MPLHVSSQLITGDGSESAKVKATVTDTEIVSSSNEYSQSNYGGNFAWMGPPPNPNESGDVMWNGGNNLPTVAVGDAITIYDGFGGGPPNNYIVGTVTEVSASSPNTFMGRVEVSVVNNFNPQGPPLWGFALTSNTTRITVDYDFTSSSNAWENLDLDPDKDEDKLTIADRNFVIAAMSGSAPWTLDIPGDMGDETPDVGSLITKPMGNHIQNVSIEQIKLDPILGMNVKRLDGTTKYVPIFEYARGGSDWDRFDGSENDPDEYFNTEQQIIGGMIRFAPAWSQGMPVDKSTLQQRSVHIGGGPLVNGNHLGRIPSTKRNISLGFEIMADVKEWNEDSSQKGAHTNIMIGWDIGENPSFQPQSSIIIGENLCRDWAGGGTNTTTYNVIMGWGCCMESDGGANSAENINNTGNVIIGNEAARHAGGRNIDNNVAIGQWANYSMFGDEQNSSSGNVAIGYQSGHWHGWSQGMPRASFSNNIDIGKNAHSPTWGSSNECTLGDSNITALRCNQTTITGLSDRRDKSNIEDLPDEAGMAFIKTLSPKTFNWDRRKDYQEEKHYEEGDDIPEFFKVGDPYYIDHERNGDKIELNFDWDKPNSGLQMGFIAQDLQDAINNTGATTQKALEDCKLVYDRNPDYLEARPQELIVPMVKAIQELCARIEVLENE